MSKNVLMLILMSFFSKSQNGSNTCPPKIAFDDDHSDYVIMSKDAGKNPEAQNPDCDNDAALRSIERKTTKKRIKMLRWLKKAIVDKGQDDTTVIGDIYRIKSVDNHVKLWCLLRDRQLYCYLNMTDTTPDCVIPLDNCSAVPTTVISGKKFAFDIEKEGVKLATFAARSAKERARWFEIVKSKRGMIPLAEIEDDSGDEAAGSGTSEDDDNDSHEYVQGNEILYFIQKSRPLSLFVQSYPDSRRHLESLLGKFYNWIRSSVYSLVVRVLEKPETVESGKGCWRKTCLRNYMNSKQIFCVVAFHTFPFMQGLEILCQKQIISLHLEENQLPQCKDTWQPQV